MVNITETSYCHRRMICESSPTCCRIAAAPAGVPVRYSGHTIPLHAVRRRRLAQWRACRRSFLYCPARRVFPYSLIDSIFQILTTDHNTHPLHCSMNFFIGTYFPFYPYDFLYSLYNNKLFSLIQTCNNVKCYIYYFIRSSQKYIN